MFISKRHDMIIELGEMEKLMSSFSDELRILSKKIRNTIWKLSDEQCLANTLYSCNVVLRKVVEIAGEQSEIVDMYIDYLDKKSDYYSKISLNTEYYDVRSQIWELRIQKIFKQQWKQINPDYRKEYLNGNVLSKDLISILDNFFDTVIKVCPEQFLIQLDDTKFSRLIRGRREVWHSEDDLRAPSIEIAKKNNIINRWNPPNKRYLYLVAGNGTYQDIETACEEMRIKTGETVTLADFEVCQSFKKQRIVNLDYERISKEDIFDFVDLKNNELKNEIINNIISNGSEPTEQIVMEQIQLKRDKVTLLANLLIGKLFVKELCEAIFVPLDEKEDNDKEQKDKCYKSFHILAEYIEKRRYVGICYPSTRMKLIGKNGSNLVLFNADSANPLLETFQYIVK